MKGKIAFVLGAAVGYVLGSRAGRERYEQIKRGAESLWATEPVQRGVDAVKDVAQVRVDQVKDSMIRAGKGAFAAMMRDSSAQKPAEKHGAARPAGGSASTAGGSASTAGGSGSGSGASAPAGETGTATAKRAAAERKAADISTPEPDSAQGAGKPDEK